MTQTGVAVVASEPGPAVPSVAPIAGRSPWRLAWERLRRDRVAMVSMVIIVIIFLLAILAPLVASFTGHDPDAQFRKTGLTPDGLPRGPSGEFWLGTDDLGRDLFVRIIYGARISLLVGVVATVITIVVGVLVGLAAGYYGGIIDILLARAVDVVLSLPFILFAVSLVSITGPSLWIAIVVIALFSWASVARIVRGQVLSIREKEYVEAARSLGSSDARIMLLDVLPNVLAPVIVYTTLLIPIVIGTEATLSFLGLGVPPPAPSWGAMLAGGRTHVLDAPHVVLAPAAAILVVVLGTNVLGDALVDRLDPARRPA